MPGYRLHRFPLCGHVERVWFSGPKTLASCSVCAQRRRDAITAKPGMTRAPEPRRDEDDTPSFSPTMPSVFDYTPTPAPEPSPPSFDSGGGGDFGGGGASGEF